MLVRALVDGVPERIDAPGRVEVRGEAVMLRSTFAAYNAAHPDKPLINPRNAAAGTLRAKDPATVAERRLQFFAFDLDTASDGADDRSRARRCRRSGSTAADMRHCADADAAQAVIAAIEQQRNDLGLRPRRRRAAAGRPRRLRGGRHPVELAARRAGVQVRRRGEDHACWPMCVWDVGKTGKIAPVAQLEPVFVGGTTVTRATLANQEVIRARGIKIGDTVLVRRAGDVIPFVAGVLDASKRTGAEQEIVPPTDCPSCGRAADRAGQQPGTVLHQRRLPRADRAAADPLGVARRGRHRGHRSGVDRAAGRGRGSSSTRRTSTR